MWARRCGAPPKMPSRIKVIVFSIFSGSVGLSIYTYMASSTISYLDLEKPASPNVLCLEEWPLRSHAISWAHPKEMFSFSFFPPSAMDNTPKKVCEVVDLSHITCGRNSIPAHQMKRPLALAMDGALSQVTRYDVLGGWARFFLLIGGVIWMGMTTHDLALIGRYQKNFILDVGGVNEHCPCIRKVWRSLAGHRVLLRVARQENFHFKVIGLILAILLAPVLIAWNILLFMLVIVPLTMGTFLRYPVRMSRAWVFVASLACSLYGLGLTIQQLTFVFEPDLRPHYALTWVPESLNTTTGEYVEAPCTCGCDYPISFSVIMNLVIIGVGTTVKSVFLAFRCLKGLRRSQWASLLSVMFPVPITMYEVDWRQPNGQPIRMRSETVPVQGEVAFDPFALMDEQDDSAFTTIHLRPEPVNRYENRNGHWARVPNNPRILETPAVPQAHYRKAEYVGCCGFPWPTGGTQCVYDPEFISQLDSRASSDAGVGDLEQILEQDEENQLREAAEGSPCLPEVDGPARAEDVNVNLETGGDAGIDFMLAERRTSVKAELNAETPAEGEKEASRGEYVTPQRQPRRDSPVSWDQVTGERGAARSLDEADKGLDVPSPTAMLEVRV